MEIVLILGIIAGAIGSLSVIWHKGIKPFYRFCKRLAKVADVVADLPEWQYTVGLSLLELQPNHGSSMKDKVDKLAIDLPIVREMAEKHIADHAVHRRES